MLAIRLALCILVGADYRLLYWTLMGEFWLSAHITPVAERILRFVMKLLRTPSYTLLRLNY
jgi:hypothetical protein